MIGRWRGPRIGAAALSGALLLSACTGGGGDATPNRTEETRPNGGDVIREFAAAWPNPSVANLRGLVDQPVVAAHDIAAHVAGLAITKTLVTPEGDVQCTDDSCREHAQVTHQLAGFGQWKYRTLIKSRFEDGRWRIEWSPSTFHPDLSGTTTLTLHRSLPPRAPILDRNGVALTPERRIVRVGVVPREVRPATYRRLAELLGVDAAALKDRVTAAQPDWFVSVIDLRRGDYLPLRRELLATPGVAIDRGRRALAPTAEWGRAVLGTVAPATADSLKAAGPLALPTDEVGASGLQQAFQKRLAGEPGGYIDLVESATGDSLNRILSRPARPGQPLQTSLDLEAQSAVEAAVSGARRRTSVVLVKASTGEVLAAANGPGPTTYNTAFVGRYAPGSTFKTVSAAALLARGVVTPRSPVSCPDTAVVDGKRFKNYERGILRGRADFAHAYAASCNTTMVGYADDLTGTDVASTARRFGVGARWGLGIDGFSGSAPADADLVTRAADMIGQGHVLASPLLLAMIAATVDSGVSRTPTLLPGLMPGRRLTSLDEHVASQLDKMMRLVVTEGTGRVLNLPGMPVHAKTGTAEYGAGSRSGTNAWMIGYRGDLAFAVLVERGSSGAHDAAPIVRDVLERLPARLYR